jgi:hypothetical protein
MRKIIYIVMLLIVFTSTGKAFSPQNKTFGFGIQVGEPTALTGKFWLQKDQAIAFSVGNSYLGSLRFGGDYLFHFNAFNSNVVNLYAGPGIAFGTGKSGGWWYKKGDHYWYDNTDATGFGARGVFGINVVPKRTPLEIFAEFGLMIGISPTGWTEQEAALGIRFYF